MSFFCSGISSQCLNKIHNNQDTYGAIRIFDINSTEIALSIVADGVSSGFDGKYASYNAVKMLLEWAVEYFQENVFDIDIIANEIINQMQVCNHILNEYSEQHSEKDTCCTLCGMITDGNEILIFNAGDSRLYEIKKENVLCLTRDDIGTDGHSITRHIGGKEDNKVRITFSKTMFNYDSIYFLCTDGMYRRLNFKIWKNEILSIKNISDWQNTFEKMLQSVQEFGEKDDVTAVILFGSDNR